MSMAQTKFKKISSVIAHMALDRKGSHVTNDAMCPDRCKMISHSDTHRGRGDHQFQAAALANMASNIPEKGIFWIAFHVTNLVEEYTTVPPQEGRPFASIPTECQTSGGEYNLGMIH